MEEEKVSPYGNLSFSEYTFETETEKLVVALQAALKVRGYSAKSPALRKLNLLKKALKKTKKFSFNLVPREKLIEEQERTPEKTGPSKDMSGTVAEVIANCLGIPLCKKSIRFTSAGYAIVRVICVGPLQELRIPPGPEDLVTEKRFKQEVVERCHFRDSDFSSVKVLTLGHKLSKKKTNIMVTVEAIYK